MALLVEHWDRGTESWSFYSLTNGCEEVYPVAATPASAYSEYQVVATAQNDYIILATGHRRYRYAQGTKGAATIYNWALGRPIALQVLETGAPWEIDVMDYEGKTYRVERLRFQVVPHPDLAEVVCPVCYSDIHPMAVLRHMEDHSWQERLDAGYVSDHELMLEVYELLQARCIGLSVDGWEIQTLETLLHQALQCAELPE